MFEGSSSLHSCARVLLLALTTLATASACGPGKDSGAGDDTEGGSGDTTGATDGNGPGGGGLMTADATGGAGGTVGMDAGEGDVTTSSMDGSSSDEEGGFIDMPDDDADGGAPGPLGGMCDSNDGCDSGFCYSIPMVGGACSECLSDSDCEAGTCALNFQAGYAQCTDGSSGVMCDSDEGCTGDLVCAELLDTGGFFPANFCSECDDGTPCDDKSLICSPVYDLANLGGSLSCVTPQSVENGGGCPTGDGTVCATGFCGTASLFGIELGVCGECVVDEDCGDPKLSCVGPTADMSGLQHAVCQ